MSDDIDCQAATRRILEMAAVGQEFKTGRPDCPECLGWGHYLVASPFGLDNLPRRASPEGHYDGIVVKASSLVPNGVAYDMRCQRCHGYVRPVDEEWL